MEKIAPSFYHVVEMRDELTPSFSRVIKEFDEGEMVVYDEDEEAPSF